MSGASVTGIVYVSVPARRGPLSPFDNWASSEKSMASPSSHSSGVDSTPDQFDSKVTSSSSILC